MTEKKHSFSKNERLKSRKEISRLIKDGIFLFSEQISLTYVESIDTISTFNKVAVSVPKKHFKSAVKRNKIKRQIKEVYRLNKTIINNISDLTSANYTIMFIYRSKKAIPFQSIKIQVIGLLKKMSGQIKI